MRLIIPFLGLVLLFSCQNHSKEEVENENNHLINSLDSISAKFSEVSNDSLFEKDSQLVEDKLVSDSLIVLDSITIVDSAKNEVKTQKIEKKKNVVKPNVIQKESPAPSRTRVAFPEIFVGQVINKPDSITSGDKIRFQIPIKNIGNCSLQIQRVDVGCGCTVPSFPFLDMPPGSDGNIGVEYNSVGKEGLQYAELTVVSNEKQQLRKIKIPIFVKPKTILKTQEMTTPKQQNGVEDSLIDSIKIIRKE